MVLSDAAKRLKVFPYVRDMYNRARADMQRQLVYSKSLVALTALHEVKSGRRYGRPLITPSSSADRARVLEVLDSGMTALTGELKDYVQIECFFTEDVKETMSFIALVYMAKNDLDAAISQAGERLISLAEFTVTYDDEDPLSDDAWVDFQKGTLDPYYEKVISVSANSAAEVKIEADAGSYWKFDGVVFCDTIGTGNGGPPTAQNNVTIAFGAGAAGNAGAPGPSLSMSGVTSGVAGDAITITTVGTHQNQVHITFHELVPKSADLDFSATIAQVVTHYMRPEFAAKLARVLPLLTGRNFTTAVWDTSVAQDGAAVFVSMLGFQVMDDGNNNTTISKSLKSFLLAFIPTALAVTAGR